MFRFWTLGNLYLMLDVGPDPAVYGYSFGCRTGYLDEYRATPPWQRCYCRAGVRFGWFRQLRGEARPIWRRLFLHWSSDARVLQQRMFAGELRRYRYERPLPPRRGV